MDSYFEPMCSVLDIYVDEAEAVKDFTSQHLLNNNDWRNVSVVGDHFEIRDVKSGTDITYPIFKTFDELYNYAKSFVYHKHVLDKVGGQSVDFDVILDIIRLQNEADFLDLVNHDILEYFKDSTEFFYNRKKVHDKLLESVSELGENKKDAITDLILNSGEKAFKVGLLCDVQFIPNEVEYSEDEFISVNLYRSPIEINMKIPRKAENIPEILAAAGKRLELYIKALELTKTKMED